MNRWKRRYIMTFRILCQGINRVCYLHAISFMIFIVMVETLNMQILLPFFVLGSDCIVPDFNFVWHGKKMCLFIRIKIWLSRQKVFVYQTLNLFGTKIVFVYQTLNLFGTKIVFVYQTLNLFDTKYGVCLSDFKFVWH